MSFGDFASSGRGPGTIGLILALVVLVGFGAIYVSVFDADLEGKGTSLSAAIRQQATEIEDLKHQLETNRSMVQEVDKTEQENARMDAIVANSEANAKKIEEIKASLTGINESILNTTKEMNAYVANYRTLIRGAAVGEKVAELKTVNGRVYMDVEIRSVSDIGLDVRHADGIGRVAFEDLPADWQERFQFDPQEKAKALAREKAAQDLYDQALQVAAEESKDISSDVEAPATAPQIQSAIRTKTLELARLKMELKRLHVEAVKVEAADSIGRASGNSKADQIRGLRTRIQAVESKMSDVVRQLGKLRTRQSN